MYLNNSNILITGGTGTLGKVLLTKILKHNPNKVIIFSRDEYKQAKLREKFPNPKYPVRYFLGDIRDKDRLKKAFKSVNYVVHCAALKRIESGEIDPEEVVKTNITGAQNVVSAAIDCNVRKCFLISSDKAVNPSTLYGATKLCADKIALAAKTYASSTNFATIRPGNFYNSRGSVVELFKMIKGQGGHTYPITDVRMTRFFITPHRAAELVLEALGIMQGGEIFLPKMRSYNIVDLPKMIDRHAKIKIIGSRPGEKLHEEMLLDCDVPNTYETDNFYVVSTNGKRGVKVPADFKYTSEKGLNNDNS